MTAEAGTMTAAAGAMAAMAGAAAVRTETAHRAAVLPVGIPPAGTVRKEGDRAMEDAPVRI